MESKSPELAQSGIMFKDNNNKPCINITNEGMQFCINGEWVDINKFILDSFNGAIQENNKHIKQNNKKESINMNIISKGRQTGKTTGLIYTSEATGYPIVVPTEFSIKYVLDMAEKMGCEIPTPVTVGQLRHYSNDSNQYVCVCYVTGLTTAYCKGVCSEIKQMLKNSFNNKIDTVYFEY